MFLRKARKCNGFPNILRNHDRLALSIASMLSRTLPSVPAWFCHKIHHSGSTCKSWSVPGLRLADQAAKSDLELYRAVQGSTCLGLRFLWSIGEDQAA